MSFASPFSEFSAHVLAPSPPAGADCLGDRADGPGTAPPLMMGL